MSTTEMSTPVVDTTVESTEPEVKESVMTGQLSEKPSSTKEENDEEESDEEDNEESDDEDTKEEKAKSTIVKAESDDKDECFDLLSDEYANYINSDLLNKITDESHKKTILCNLSMLRNQILINTEAGLEYSNRIRISKKFIDDITDQKHIEEIITSYIVAESMLNNNKLVTYKSKQRTKKKTSCCGLLSKLIMHTCAISFIGFVGFVACTTFGR